MKARPNKWTDADLELYHDGELEPARRAALAEALRKDIRLRERLAAIRKADELMRKALLAVEQTTSRPARPAVRWRLAAPLAVAACLGLMVVTAWRFAARETATPSNIGEPVAISGQGAAAPGEYEAIRVVFSLPNSRTGPFPRAASKSPPPAGAADEQDAEESQAKAQQPFMERLDELLAAGEVEQAVEMLSKASDAQRRAGYRRIGKVLRSFASARRVLRRLPPQQQVEVCGEWARNPALRSLAFDQLSDLIADPEVSEAAVATAARLSEERVLAGWVRGRQLLRQPPSQRLPRHRVASPPGSVDDNDDRG